ncbi:alcohol dehydrogenase, putative [Leishmania donovani]|uniref:Alcohol dehydrogenase 4 n=2 Tax=Leishmania donovani TaxID=5661 RepID=E9BLV3_LEIDO|nr:alcohol dehydrogenase, putative [Leishmania donovani]AYU81009.1 alcohol dehydrogenase, putative [Leishmania donovani]CBZ36231.1 alcohol dehydrogenase, putative [Leishmania donovani]
MACRSYQFTICATSYLLRWRAPAVTQGSGALATLPHLVRGARLKRGLLVTDAMIMKLGLVDDFIDEMKKQGAELAIYKDVLPNPTIDMVEEASALYKKNKCDCLVAVGGGSVMDCAKLIGVRQARPRTPLPYMRGLLRVLWPLPPLIAVPTTAGTGSECTIAAVVSDPAKKDKLVVMDPFLTPSHCVLDPALTMTLPKFVTATTGMDALTHVVEAYTNVFHYRTVDKAALRAMELLAKYLPCAYKDGSNLEAREKMLQASYLAGLSFTRAGVGNVHAAAHAVGGLYNVPHGYANAVILPHVLDMYGSAAHKSLARLAEAANIVGGNDAEKAANFISWVREMNAQMQIPTTLGASDSRWVPQEEDIPFLVKHAVIEANPFYAVPVIFGEEEMTELFRRIM